MTIIEARDDGVVRCEWFLDGKRENGHFNEATLKVVDGEDITITTAIERACTNSGNQCTFPKCPTLLVRDERGLDPKTIGKIALRIATVRRGPRHDPNIPEEDLNKPSNFIMLCCEHYTAVNQNTQQYTIEVLRKMKFDHEQSVGPPHVDAMTNDELREALQEYESRRQTIQKKLDAAHDSNNKTKAKELLAHLCKCKRIADCCRSALDEQLY